MPVIRTASIRRLPVHIKVDHLVQTYAENARTLTAGERVHDSQPHLEKVLFDVDVDWNGDDTIGFNDQIESVFNYAPIYHLLVNYFHERDALKAPLESILDLVVSKAAMDSRVTAVHVSAERPNILLSGSVVVSVNWVRETVQAAPFPVCA